MLSSEVHRRRRRRRRDSIDADVSPLEAVPKFEPKFPRLNPYGSVGRLLNLKGKELDAVYPLHPADPTLSQRLFSLAAHASRRLALRQAGGASGGSTAQQIFEQVQLEQSQQAAIYHLLSVFYTANPALGASGLLAALDAYMSASLLAPPPAATATATVREAHLLEQLAAGRAAHPLLRRPRPGDPQVLDLDLDTPSGDVDSQFDDNPDVNTQPNTNPDDSQYNNNPDVSRQPVTDPDVNCHLTTNLDLNSHPNTNPDVGSQFSNNPDLNSQSNTNSDLDGQPRPVNRPNQATWDRPATPTEAAFCSTNPTTADHHDLDDHPSLEINDNSNGNEMDSPKTNRDQQQLDREDKVAEKASTSAVDPSTEAVMVVVEEDSNDLPNQSDATHDSHHSEVELTTNNNVEEPPLPKPSNPPSLVPSSNSLDSTTSRTDHSNLSISSTLVQLLNTVERMAQLEGLRAEGRDVSGMVEQFEQGVALGDELDTYPELVDALRTMDGRDQSLVVVFESTTPRQPIPVLINRICTVFSMTADLISATKVARYGTMLAVVLTLRTTLHTQLTFKLGLQRRNECCALGIVSLIPAPNIFLALQERTIRNQNKRQRNRQSQSKSVLASLLCE